MAVSSAAEKTSRDRPTRMDSAVEISKKLSSKSLKRLDEAREKILHDIRKDIFLQLETEASRTVNKMLMQNDLALCEVGKAHRDAAALPNYKSLQEEKLKIYRDKAVMRGREALQSRMRILATQKNYSVKVLENRKNAKEMANLHSKFVNSMFHGQSKKKKAGSEKRKTSSGNLAGKFVRIQASDSSAAKKTNDSDKPKSVKKGMFAEAVDDPRKRKRNISIPPESAPHERKIKYNDSFSSQHRNEPANSISKSLAKNKDVDSKSLRHGPIGTSANLKSQKSAKNDKETFNKAMASKPRINALTREKLAHSKIQEELDGVGVVDSFKPTEPDVSSLLKPLELKLNRTKSKLEDLHRRLQVQSRNERKKPKKPESFKNPSEDEEVFMLEDVATDLLVHDDEVENGTSEHEGLSNDELKPPYRLSQLEFDQKKKDKMVDFLLKTLVRKTDSIQRLNVSVSTEGDVEIPTSALETSEATQTDSSSQHSKEESGSRTSTQHVPRSPKRSTESTKAIKFIQKKSKGSESEIEIPTSCAECDTGRHGPLCTTKITTDKKDAVNRSMDARSTGHGKRNSKNQQPAPASTNAAKENSSSDAPILGGLSEGKHTVVRNKKPKDDSEGTPQSFKVAQMQITDKEIGAQIYPSTTPGQNTSPEITSQASPSTSRATSKSLEPENEKILLEIFLNKGLHLRSSVPAEGTTLPIIESHSSQAIDTKSAVQSVEENGRKHREDKRRSDPIELKSKPKTTNLKLTNFTNVERLNLDKSHELLFGAKHSKTDYNTSLSTRAVANENEESLKKGFSAPLENLQIQTTSSFAFDVTIPEKTVENTISTKRSREKDTGKFGQTTVPAEAGKFGKNPSLAATVAGPELPHKMATSTKKESISFSLQPPSVLRDLPHGMSSEIKTDGPSRSNTVRSSKTYGPNSKAKLKEQKMDVVTEDNDSDEASEIVSRRKERVKSDQGVHIDIKKSCTLKEKLQQLSEMQKRTTKDEVSVVSMQPESRRTDMSLSVSEYRTLAQTDSSWLTNKTSESSEGKQYPDAV